MIEEAIILAGGFGSRLKGVVSDVPKPMAPTNNRPFLEYLLDHLLSEGFQRIILAVGYKSELIKQHFGSHYRSLELIYATENIPLGTGGAIKLALQKVQGTHVAILNGDTFFPIHFTRFFNLHQNKNPEVTIALKKVNNAERYGTIKMDKNQQIIRFIEKGQKGKGFINCGIYLLNTSKFIQRKLADKFSFETDYLEEIAPEQSLFGQVFDNYFIDIGIPESYAQAQIDFKSYT